MQDMKSLLRPPVRTSLTGWLAVFTLLICSAGLAYLSFELKRHSESTAIMRERMEQKIEASNRSAIRISPEQARHWQALKAEIAFPWDRIFRVIESATTSDIELLEMVPDKARRSVVLRGEARNIASVVTYIRLLADHAEIDEAFVSRMQYFERAGLQTIEFEIRMSLT
jgi:hypothetical protein